MPKELQTADDALWKQRYRVPQTYTVPAKANPTRGLAISNRSGVYQLYAWDLVSGDLIQLTDRPNGKIGGVIAPDGRHVYYHDDQRGNEIGQYVRVPFAGGVPEPITPELPPYSSWSLSLSRACNMLGFAAASDGKYTVYTQTLNGDALPDAPRQLYQSSKMTFSPVLSFDGALGVVMSSERGQGPQFNLIAFDLASGERIGELWDGADTSITARMFAPVAGDERVLASSNRSGTSRPLLWNARTGDRVDLAVDELPGDMQPEDWSPDGQVILLRHFSNAVQQLYLYDLLTNTVQPLDHPSGTISSAYFVSDHEVFVHLQTSTQPTQLIAIDLATAMQRVVMANDDVPPGRPWRSISFASSDGQMIQGWLATPDGDGPFPTILETHGGPAAVQMESFSASSQAWLDHGFAFLSINYRGSTSFGKAFEEQIWGDLGHWELEDMAAAREYVIREQIAQPDAILLTGWSYGGYLTLMGLGKQPELWAGGMAGIAIADWAMQYEDTADTLKGYQVAMLGGTPDEKPEEYRRSSPITYAEQVQAPVLVIQGSNDTRCPPRPMQAYEARLRELGKDITVHWFEAGHGSYAVDQSIEHQELMLRFAYGMLG